MPQIFMGKFLRLIKCIFNHLYKIVCIIHYCRISIVTKTGGGTEERTTVNLMKLNASDTLGLKLPGSLFLAMPDNLGLNTEGKPCLIALFELFKTAQLSTTARESEFVSNWFSDEHLRHENMLCFISIFRYSEISCARAVKPWIWNDFIFYNITGDGKESRRCLKTLHDFTLQVHIILVIL